MTTTEKDTTCSDCGKEFKYPVDLKKHKNKKHPCQGGKFPCSKCNKCFQYQSGRSRHEKTCTGRVLTTQQVLVEQVRSLQTQLQTAQLAGGTNVLPEIKTVLDLSVIDINKPQLYFGIPGPKLVSLSPLPAGALKIKAGITNNFPNRSRTHRADFGGFTWIDSIIICNPASVEKKLKEWLRVNNMQIKCKTEKKKSKDTEIFIVKSQQDYERIVRDVQRLVEEDTRQWEEARERENKAEIDEIEKLEARLTVLKTKKAKKIVTV